MGANGTGKSSFAEGLEFLLTGQNSRWQDKSAEWRHGWRNLHAQDPPELQAVFAVEGAMEDTVVSRRWSAEDAGQIEDHALEGLEYLEWESALDTHRPFLSYDQLSDIVEKGPSARFDAMAAGLGLERLTEAREQLRGRYLEDQRAYRAAREQRDELLAEVQALDDERAYRVRGALAEEPWRLERIHLALEGVLGDEDLVNGASPPVGLQRMTESPPSYRDRPLWLLQRFPAVYGYQSDLPGEDSMCLLKRRLRTGTSPLIFCSVSRRLSSRLQRRSKRPAESCATWPRVFKRSEAAMRRAQLLGTRRFRRRFAYTPTKATKSVPPAKQDAWMNAGRTWLRSA